MTRSEKLDLIFRNTHSDFRGYASSECWGKEHACKPTIMVYRSGTCLILLEDMTDEEIAKRLPSALAFAQRTI